MCKKRQLWSLSICQISELKQTLSKVTTRAAIPRIGIELLAHLSTLLRGLALGVDRDGVGQSFHHARVVTEVESLLCCQNLVFVYL